MAAGIEEQVFWFDIPMGNTLRVQVGYPEQYLLKTALNLAWAHPTLLDSSVEIPTGTILHHLAPVLVLILYEVDGLDNIDVMQR